MPVSDEAGISIEEVKASFVLDANVAAWAKIRCLMPASQIAGSSSTDLLRSGGSNSAGCRAGRSDKVETAIRERCNPARTNCAATSPRRWSCSLPRNTVDVILDRGVLDSQDAGDLLVAAALADQGGDLVFAPRQRRAAGCVASIGRECADAAAQCCRGARRANQFSTHGAVYRGHDILH